jgi:hypothetical protein
MSRRMALQDSLDVTSQKTAFSEQMKIRDMSAPGYVNTVGTILFRHVRITSASAQISQHNYKFIPLLVAKIADAST